MKKFVLAAAIAAVVGTFGMSHAAVNVEVALPGAGTPNSPVGFAFGVGGVAMVATKGAPFTFANSDPIASHDMVSDAKTRTGGALFTSHLIPAGQTETVDLSHTSVGQTYTFHCTLHAWMKGSLTVLS